MVSPQYSTRYIICIIQKCILVYKYSYQVQYVQVSQRCLSSKQTAPVDHSSKGTAGKWVATDSGLRLRFWIFPTHTSYLLVTFEYLPQYIYYIYTLPCMSTAASRHICTCRLYFPSAPTHPAVLYPITVPGGQTSARNSRVDSVEIGAVWAVTGMCSPVPPSQAM